MGYGNLRAWSHPEADRQPNAQMSLTPAAIEAPAIPAEAAGTSVQTVMAAVIVFGVPFAMFYRLIMFHFYVRGGLLFDSGLLASLMWHSPIALPMPQALGG